MAETFNAATYLVGRHCARGAGDRVAVRGSVSTLTYAELDRLVADVAGAFRRLGLRRDDRVMLVMSDDVEMLATLLGAFRAGLVAVPVSTMFNGSELGTILADCGARALVATSEHTVAVGSALRMAPELEHVVLHGAGQLPVPAWATLHTWDDFASLGIADEADRSTAATTDDSWALWLYTSGTTGTPKAAMHRHANVRHVCETYGAQVLRIGPGDVTFSIAKLFFAYGIGNSLFFPMSVGATTVLDPRRPTPGVVLDRLERDQPTLFFGVPTFYGALLASDLRDDVFSSVRLAVSAGEPLPAPLQEKFTSRFGVEIIDGIGSTEALHIFLSNGPGQVRPGTTGLPVPGYDVEIRDAQGVLVPVGEPGALYVRGASIALGYWRQTDATRRVFVGEWLSTGDTYVRSQDGYYSCLGRNSDMLKAGGIWVSPTEVESRLLTHPAVSQAAVVGLPDGDGLDKPVAAVVADPSIDEEALLAWCRDGLSHFKAPRRIVFVDDLPKTATGKLQRFKVRDLIAAPAPGIDPAVKDPRRQETAPVDELGVTT
jgi:benzoate-CoA ligase family protein